MVGGIESVIPDVDTGVEKEVARQRLEEVSEEYNMGLENVDLEFDYSLPRNVMGQTEYNPGYGTKIRVGPSFLNASKPEQLKTMLHEGFHFKQFEGEDIDWLAQNTNASDELLNEVKKARTIGTEEEIEGITEVVTDQLLPFNAGTGYPYLKRKKKSELKQKGIDVESELVQDIEDEINSVIDNYKEVYESFSNGNIYLEHGEVDGVGYSAITVGYDDGEQIVNDYLEEIVDEGLIKEEELGVEYQEDDFNMYEKITETIESIYDSVEEMFGDYKDKEVDGSVDRNTDIGPGGSDILNPQKAI